MQKTRQRERMVALRAMSRYRLSNMIRTDLQKQAQRTDVGLCLRLLREARAYYSHLCLFFIVSLLATPVALLTPYPLKMAIDSGLGETPLPVAISAIVPQSVTGSPTAILALSAILVVLVMLITQIHWVASALLRTIISERMLLDFRAKLFRHVQRLSFSFHDTNGTSDSTYRIQWDAASIQYVTIDGVIPFVTSLFTLVAMIFVIFALDWQLGLVALVVSPFLITAARFFRPRLRERAQQLKRLESSAFSVIPEALGALRVVKAFGQEIREQERFEGKSLISLRAKLRYQLTESAMGMTVGVTTAAGTALVLYVGARHVLTGEISLGVLLLVMSYIGQLYGPLKSISNKVATMQRHLASAERVFSLLDEPMDVPERAHARSIQRANGNVQFDKVSFGYTDGPRVLSEVCFDIPAGRRVGIAGRTGAGKTTLVSLLMRFYDVSQGAIRFDGVDLRDYRVDDLRSQFAMVLQDPVLFSTTIAENIAYGRPDATEHEIVGAAKAANAHDFILALPDGYSTSVGERGMRLSGGERQRISLARAFLKDAPILILDEPTSSVDIKTESLIMDAMSRLMAGRTTFMIAHRLSTLENCDVVLVVENGTVTERRPNGNRVLAGSLLNAGTNQ